MRSKTTKSLLSRSRAYILKTISAAKETFHSCPVGRARPISQFSAKPMAMAMDVVRTGKNPSTGASLTIPATTVSRSFAAAKFKAVVDPKAVKRSADQAAE